MLTCPDVILISVPKLFCLGLLMQRGKPAMARPSSYSTTFLNPIITPSQHSDTFVLERTTITLISLTFDFYGLCTDHHSYQTSRTSNREWTLGTAE